MSRFPLLLLPMLLFTSLAAAQEMQSSQTQSENETPITNETPVPDHHYIIAPYPENETRLVELQTSEGNIQCTLFAGQHPLTVLNFMALSEGNPAWHDANDQAHDTPYYRNLKFGKKQKKRYAAIDPRPEGTNFVIPDERCQSHKPVAGAIAMVQPYPGNASAQFILFADDMPEFMGLYTIFGQCSPIETIQRLTTQDATLERILLKSPKRTPLKTIKTVPVKK